MVSSFHDLREFSLALRHFTEEKFTHQAESLPRLDCENLGVSENRSRHSVKKFRVAGPDPDALRLFRIWNEVFVECDKAKRNTGLRDRVR